MKIKTSDIIVKQRARVDFGDISSLAISIRDKGLIEPIVVEQMVDGSFELLAGERRLRACRMIQLAEVDVVTREQLNDIQRKEIELEENLLRKELTWVEQLKLTNELHQLKQSIHGAAGKGARTDVTGNWGIKQTAAFLGLDDRGVARDLELAKKLTEHPEYAELIKNLPKSAAAKIIKRTEQANEAKLINFDFSSSIDLKLGKAEDLIAQIPDESIGMSFSDPPYGYDSAESRVFSSEDTRYSYTKDGFDKECNISTPEEMLAVYKRLIPQMFNKFKQGAYFFWLVGSPRTFVQLEDIFNMSGFICYPTELVWNKMWCISPHNGYTFRRSHTLVIYGYKPPHNRELMLANNEEADILNFRMQPPQNRVHPLQICEELISFLIKSASLEGDIIFDPFGGSGSTGLASYKLKRKSVLFEANEGNYLRSKGYIAEQLVGVKVS